MTKRRSHSKTYRWYDEDREVLDRLKEIALKRHGESARIDETKVLRLAMRTLLEQWEKEEK